MCGRAGVGGEVHLGDALLGSEGFVGEDVLGPIGGFLVDEGVVHEDEGLGGDVGDASAAHGVERGGGVEGEEHGGEEISADFEVDGAAAGAVEGAAGGGFAAAFHEGSEVDLDAGAAHGEVELVGDA